METKECKKCGVNMAASLKGSEWVVTKAPVSQPCSHSGSVSVASSVSVVPAAVTAVVAPSPSAAALVVPEVVECCTCFDADVPKASAVMCTSAREHAYCQECFGNHVKTICENRAAFLKDEARFFCMQCRIDGSPSSEHFDMQTAGAK